MVDAGVRLKLTPVVVWPTVTDAVCVPELNPTAVVVRVWLPALRPLRVYPPELFVVVLAPPLSVTVAPATAPPPEALVTVPVTAPVLPDADLELSYPAGPSTSPWS